MRYFRCILAGTVSRFCGATKYPESLLEEWSRDHVPKIKNVLDSLSQKWFATVRDPDAVTVGERHPFLKDMDAMIAMKAGPGPGPKGSMPSLHTDVT